MVHGGLIEPSSFLRNQKVPARDIANMVFNPPEFWVQVHNPPLVCMSEEICLFSNLGNMIGEVRDIDLEAEKNDT